MASGVKIGRKTTKYREPHLQPQGHRGPKMRFVNALATPATVVAEP
jgi:hypothetical protein